jgi:formylmethanofuran dehydrogenase subunit E
MEPLKENQIIDEYVYRVLCSHETEDGGIKNVIVNCGEQKGVQHRIRQWGDGYICGHCSELIMSACNVKVGDKIVCYQCKGSD